MIDELRSFGLKKKRKYLKNPAFFLNFFHILTPHALCKI